MCGIVGLLVKKPRCAISSARSWCRCWSGMTERGPDSAGLAVYTDPVAEDRHKLSLYSGENFVDWDELDPRAAAEFGPGTRFPRTATTPS